MKKFVHEVCLLSAGVTFGIVIGGTVAVAAVMSSDVIRNALADAFADKIVTAIYGNNERSVNNGRRSQILRYDQASKAL